MSVSSALKKSVTVAGLSLLALTAAFNEAAYGQNAAPAAPVTAPLRANQAALDTQMSTLFNDIGLKLDVRARDPRYSPADDPALLAMKAKIYELLEQGANPNHYEQDALSFAGSKNLTVFEAAVTLAYIMNDPKLVSAFISHGADVHKKASDDWSPVDYAVTNFLGAQSSSKKDAALALAILLSLEKAGASVSEATQIAKVPALKRMEFRDHKDLVANVVGLSVLLDAGLMTRQEFEKALGSSPELAQAMSKATHLDKAFLVAHGAKINDFPDAPPGGPEPYTVVKGDTIESLAARFRAAMGAVDVKQAKAMLIAQNASVLPSGNQITLSTPLPENLRILIPVPKEHQIGQIEVMPGTTIAQLVKALKPVYYKKGATDDEIAADIATMNGLNLADLKSGKEKLVPGQKLMVTFFNDAWASVVPLDPPRDFDRTREVSVAAIEGPVSYHAKETFSVISNTGYGLNRDVNLSRFFSWDEVLLDYPAGIPGVNSDALLMFMANAAGSPLQDTVVFSHSMGMMIGPEARAALNEIREADNAMYETARLILESLEKSKPIIFNASGNWYIEEGRVMQSTPLEHSPRTVTVGAQGQYPLSPKGEMGKIVSPYSSNGADVCAPLPQFIGDQMEGTSFSTPYLAALYRQLSEWYGDRLTFEEIMAVGLMTADRDVLAYDDPGIARATSQPPASAYATSPLKYRTNGAGVPINEQCGAGVINAQRWNETLKKMVELKKTINHPVVERSFRIDAGKPAQIVHAENGGKIEYVYRMTVPEALTLGRLTFLVPQERGHRGDVVVRTPGGYEMRLPPVDFDIVSTFDFAYEDVKAGDVIEIRTTEPLAATAGMVLRGETPGNAIQLMRNHLRAIGVLPDPGKTMSGNIVTGKDPGENVMTPAKSVVPAPKRAFSPANQNGETPRSRQMPIAPTPR